MFRYTVSCKFSEKAVQDLVADRWLAWLRDAHIQDVIDAGANSAEIVQLIGEAADEKCLEIRYVFANEKAFRKYESEEAPRLRDEGLRLFPLELGLTYSRSLGQVMFAV